MIGYKSIESKDTVAKKSDFVIIGAVQGQLVANVMKSHLESEGIPVLLEYESAGIVYGVAVDGLGEVEVPPFLVPPIMRDFLPSPLVV